MQPIPPQPRRRSRTLLLVLLGVGALLLACIGAATISGLMAANEPAASPQVGRGTSAAVATTAPAPAPTSAATPRPTTPAPVYIEDGVWTVGLDIPAGRYRTTTNVESGCYWAIVKTGSNGRDIIANDLPAGGRPSVTLKAGQDFETRDCGKWSKVG